MSIVLIYRGGLLTSGAVTPAHYLGLFAGALILLIGGYIDDRHKIPPAWQFVFPILAALFAISGGLEVRKITNPFGGYVFPGAFSDILVFLWLIGMMYTTKLLDGLDGLATSVGSVGVLMVLLLAGSVAFFQPDMAYFSAILLGAFLGFLVWNLHPAKVFLGEGGSLLIGYILGALAVIAGSKIATLLLVMGVPILDVLWVMVRRIRKRQGLFKGDRKHLHHRLYDAGFSENQVVLLYTALALVFGLLTLVLSSFAKLLALILLALVVLIGAFVLLQTEKKKPAK